ncbi:MAG: hypothetical protein Unbinned706contig1001_5 [Prokaryotic dsDNA virus sp.]|nr:MAG: hypothetical protein Unbinned706contig1001_5 [Prokaryotic dsDNA virus sp.]|tara:strand:- start:8316 stop:9098 length:783 start_codon:yes stop_codon:yes gene_type:complete
MKKEILIPQEWSDVTLGEFIKLSELDINSFDNAIEYYLRMLVIFGNDNLDDIKEFLKISDINDIIGQMSFLNTLPKQLDLKSVIINDVEYHLSDNLNKLTVGEYVSIESLIEQNKLTSISAISTILSVILRPKGEEFNADLVNSRIKLFENELNIEQVIKMSLFFFEWRKVITYNFSGLFSGKKEDEEDVIIDGPAAPEFDGRWRWFSMIERLANGDITKFEEVYKISYISALNTLSYWKERDDYQERLRKRQEMMSKHR